MKETARPPSNTLSPTFRVLLSRCKNWVSTSHSKSTASQETSPTTRINHTVQLHQNVQSPDSETGRLRSLGHIRRVAIPSTASRWACSGFFTMPDAGPLFRGSLFVTQKESVNHYFVMQLDAWNGGQRPSKPLQSETG